MRRRVIIVACLLAILVVAVAYVILSSRQPTRFAQGTVVEVLPSAISADVGQSFAINIAVVDVQNLYAVDIIVNWNSSVLQLVNADVRLAPTDADGVLYNSSSDSVYIVTNSTYPGYYEISATSQGPHPFSGSGNIVRITFNVTGSGYSSIDLTKSELWDYALVREPPISMQIEHSTVGGQFSTTNSSAPATLLFVEPEKPFKERPATISQST